MKDYSMILGVIRQMTFYGAGAGIALGLLYFCVAPGIGLLVGFIAGATMGLIAGLMMAALIQVTSRSAIATQRNRSLMGGLNSLVSASVTFWLVYSIMARYIQGPLRDPLTVALIAMPPLFAAVAAFLATMRVFAWVEVTERHL
jgi:hypothetical protein